MSKRVPVSFTVTYSDKEERELRDAISNHTNGDSVGVMNNLLEETRRQKRELEYRLAYVTAVELALSEHVVSLNKSHWTEADNYARCERCDSSTRWRYDYSPACFPVCRSIEKKREREERHAIENAGKDILAAWAEEQGL